MGKRGPSRHGFSDELKWVAQMFGVFWENDFGSPKCI